MNLHETCCKLIIYLKTKYMKQTSVFITFIGDGIKIELFRTSKKTCVLLGIHY